MEVRKYLCVRYPLQKGRGYAKATVRITTQLPKLSAQEVALQLDINLPDELFLRPQLKASITVSSDNVSPPVIEAEVLSNISEIVQKELGVDLKINLIVPEEGGA